MVPLTWTLGLAQLCCLARELVATCGCFDLNEGSVNLRVSSSSTPAASSLAGHVSVCWAVWAAPRHHQGAAGRVEEVTCEHRELSV